MSDLTQALGRMARSPAVRFFVIGFLILVLLIPLFMVSGLISERQSRAADVRSDVARSWGGGQQIGGPFLVVPYKVRLERKEGDKIIAETVARTAVFMPDTVSFGGKLVSEVLHRSIFDVSVYTATLSMAGRFAPPDIARADPAATSVDWREARLVLTLSDVSGLKNAATIKINGTEEIPFEPSPLLPASNMFGIHAKLGQSPTLMGGQGPIPEFSFAADLAFTGSGSVTFAPSARETRVELSSNWPHPSFMGAFSPEARSVTRDGFTAKWRVPHLARSVPQEWNPAEAGIQQLAPYYFGVSFYQPVDLYDLATRATKYGVLFLATTFMAVFVLELLSGKRVHAVQYFFVGLAMLFFYVLLLSLSEHVGFLVAYIVAALATGGMLALYAGKALASLKGGLVMLALFGLIYGFLYLVLTLEDYALLAGAILGFAALTTVMFTTLRIDWSSGLRPGPERP